MLLQSDLKYPTSFFIPPSAFQVNLYPSEPAARICIYRLSYHTWIHTWEDGVTKDFLPCGDIKKPVFTVSRSFFPLDCVFYCIAEREIENEQKEAAMLL